MGKPVGFGPPKVGLRTGIAHWLVTSYGHGYWLELVISMGLYIP